MNRSLGAPMRLIVSLSVFPSFQFYILTLSLFLSRTPVTSAFRSFHSFPISFPPLCIFFFLWYIFLTPYLLEFFNILPSFFFFDYSSYSILCLVFFFFQSVYFLSFFFFFVHFLQLVYLFQIYSLLQMLFSCFLFVFLFYSTYSL